MEKERKRERRGKGKGGKEKFLLYRVEKQRCTLNRCTHNENR